MTLLDTNPASGASPTRIDSKAAENLRFIRNAIEASQTFTTIPGNGCISMGVMALSAAALELATPLATYWLPLWLATALAASLTALYCMWSKVRLQGSSLGRAASRRFFVTLAPAFFVAIVLTVVLSGLVSREMMAAIWLLLYGAALCTCGIFTLRAVSIAGLGFLSLGTAAAFLPAGTAPLMLAAGFGGIHIGLGLYVGKHHGG